MSSAMSLTGIGLVIVATIGIGLFGLRISRTTSDFYVASRAISPRWNASAISGEYLSAASFLGVAGLVLVNGADMLWFSVGYTVRLSDAAGAGCCSAPTLRRLHTARLRGDPFRVSHGTSSLLRPGRRHRNALSASATARSRSDLPDRHRSTAGRRCSRRSRHCGDQRGRRWHALDHLRAGLPVLAETHRTGHTDLCHPHRLALRRPPGRRTRVTARRSRRVAEPLSKANGRDHPLYSTYSLLLALCFGTMGLPHVLVRFYTNPDGRAARRTTVVVLALLGLFYVFPPVYAILGRSFAPDLVAVPQTPSSCELPARMLAGLRRATCSARWSPPARSPRSCPPRRD